MEDKNLIKYDVRILGRTIPIKIFEGQEADTQNVIDGINDKISDFQLKYKNVDKLDSLIMVLLSYVFENKKPDDNQLKDQIIDKIKNLEKKINT